jgi:hypothetical protein
MSENDYYGQGQSESPQMDMQQPGGMYSSPSGGAPMYGNGQASLTDMRTSYGAGSMPGMLAYGAASGISVVGHGAYIGTSRMMADLGGMVRPISYTPPARVYSGYSGRVQQQTSFLGSLGGMTHIDDAPRGTSPYMYGLNSSYDVGERAGLAGAGFGLAAASIGATSAAGKIGSLAFGTAGGLVGGMLGYGAAAYATDKIYEGVAARRETQDYLERTSGQYIGSGSRDADQRTGAGFSRKARQDVSEFVRDMDKGDRTMGGEDLQNILKGSTNLGLFAGTSGVEDFKKKFKSIVENVKVVATTLNQTLAEGLQTMKDLKGAGIDSSAAGAISMQADVMGRASGRTASEMINMGLQGAEIFRGTGVNMGIGFQANMMNLASVRASRDAGLISQEAVAQAGGEEALAQRMTGSTLAYTQSQIGRGFGAMYAGGGGKFDQQSFMGALSGNMDMGAAALKSARNLKDPKSMMEYEVNQEKMRSEQGAMFGGKGLDIGMMNEAVMQATSIARWTHADMNTSTLFVLKNQMGLSDMEARTRLAEMKNPEAAYQAQQKAAQASMGKNIADQAIQNTAFYRVSEQVNDVVKSAADVIAKPINSMINSTAEASAEFYDKRVLGLERYDKSKTGYQAFEGQAITDEQRKLARGKTDLRRFTFGTKTAGSDLAQRLLSAKGDASSSFSDSGVGYGNGGSDDVTLDSSIIGGETAISRSNLDRMYQRAEVMSSVTPEKAAAMKEKGSLKGVLEETQNKFDSIKDFSKINNIKDLGQKLFGTDNMSESQYASLLLTTKGTRFEKMAAVDQKTATAIVSGQHEDYVVAQQESVSKIASLEGKLDIKGLEGDAKTRGYVVQAILAGTKEEKEAALANARKAGRESGKVDVTGADWQRTVARAMGNASAEDLKTARSLQNEYGVMSAREEAQGSNILSTGMSTMLASNTTLGEDDKRRLIDTARTVGGNSTNAIALVNDTKKYAEVQKLLDKAGDAGKTMSDTLMGVKGIEAMTGITDPVKQRAALDDAKIPKGMQDSLITAYAAKGHAAVEDIVSKPGREAAGTSGTSGAGATSGVGSAVGTPQEIYALQTSMNQATLQAFEALARKLGAVK